MSAWKDIFSTPPADGQNIVARRWLPDTADVFGTWVAQAQNRLLVRPSPFALQQSELWCWKPLAGDLPPWPVPHAAKDWRDPWTFPPADGTLVWIRRFPPWTPALPARWSVGDASFMQDQPSDSPFRLPWQAVWRWKPRGS